MMRSLQLRMCAVAAAATLLAGLPLRAQTSDRIEPAPGVETGRTIYERGYFYRIVADRGRRFVALRSNGVLGEDSRVACYDTAGALLWETEIALVAGRDELSPHLLGASRSVRLFSGTPADTGGLLVYGRVFETGGGVQTGGPVLLCAADSAWERSTFGVCLSPDSSRILVYAFGGPDSAASIPGRTVFCGVADSALAGARRSTFRAVSDPSFYPRLSLTNDGRIRAVSVSRAGPAVRLYARQTDPAGGGPSELEANFELAPGEQPGEPFTADIADHTYLALPVTAGRAGRAVALHVYRFDWRARTAARFATFELTGTTMKGWDDAAIQNLQCLGIERAGDGAVVVIAGDVSAEIVENAATNVAPAYGRSIAPSHDGNGLVVFHGPIAVLCARPDGTARSAAFIERSWQFSADFLTLHAPLVWRFDGSALRLLYPTRHSSTRHGLALRSVDITTGAVSAERPIVSFGSWSWCALGATQWHHENALRLFCQQHNGADWTVLDVAW